MPARWRDTIGRCARRRMLGPLHHYRWRGGANNKTRRDKNFSLDVISEKRGAYYPPGVVYVGDYGTLIYFRSDDWG